MSSSQQLMLGNAVAAPAPPPTTDPYFENVTMLLHGDGTNGAQNNTFLDSSANNFTITRGGTLTTQGAFSPYGDNWSVYFDGTDDPLYFTTTTPMVMGTSAFTMEAWIYPTSYTNPFYIIENRAYNATGAGTYIFQVAATGALQFSQEQTPTVIITSASSAVPLNTWSHVAVVRDASSVWSLYVNGVSVGTTSPTNAYNFSATNATYIGYNWDSAFRSAFGYISNLRVVKGTAVYTSGFTPSTTPLTAISGTSLLTCQSNRFLDNSVNNYAFTTSGTPQIQRFSPFSPTAEYSTSVIGASAWFDGSGSYLQFPQNSKFTFTSDFTVEGWFYTNKVTGTQPIFATDYNVTFPGLLIQIETAALYVKASSAGTSFDILNVSLGTIKPYTWYYVSVGRTTVGALRCFLNGVLISNTTNTTALRAQTTNGRVGMNQTNLFSGYLSGIRVVNGNMYSAAYTPPTAPVTTTGSTTALLLLTQNAGIYDNAEMNDLSTVGNAQISTSVKKYGTGSLAFDGTGDYLATADTPTIQLGTGDFTIEGWVYLTAASVAYGLISKGTSTTGWSVNITSGNKLQFSYTATALTGATSLSATTWYYFAVVRSGSATGNLKIYLNGTVDATSAGAVTDNFNQTSTMYVGADRVATSALNGYLDDVRITKGYARTITSSPTAAFPNQ